MEAVVKCFWMNAGEKYKDHRRVEIVPVLKMPETNQNAFG